MRKGSLSILCPYARCSASYAAKRRGRVHKDARVGQRLGCWVSVHAAAERSLAGWWWGEPTGALSRVTPTNRA